MMILLFYINKKYLKVSFKTYKLKYVLMALIAFIVYGLLSTLIYNVMLMLGMAIPESENQLAIEEMFRLTPMLLVILVAVTAPFTEEIVFRGSLIYLFGGKKLFKTKKVLYSAILSSVIVFTGVHISSEINLVLAGASQVSSLFMVAYPYLILSIALCGLFIYSRGNILVSMTFHYVVNIVATIGIMSSL